MTEEVIVCPCGFFRAVRQIVLFVLMLYVESRMYGYCGPYIRDCIYVRFAVSYGLLVVHNQVLTSHVGRLFQTHDVEDRRSNVGQTSVLHGSAVVVGHVDEWYRVE